MFIDHISNFQIILQHDMRPLGKRNVLFLNDLNMNRPRLYMSFSHFSLKA